MTVEKIGYGVGTKEFSRANLVRAMVGTTGEESAGREEILELSCNIDDMTAEDLSYAASCLREAGALEVYTQAANMKKDRPGVVFTCICHPDHRETLVTLMFRHLTTLGIREQTLHRYVLSRREYTQETELGPVRIKVSQGWGVEKTKPEFEDLRAISQETDIPLAQLRAMLQTQ
jgi:hypothetical protein